jgi:tRNA(Glu) U13 pseudouridine synthase TruD
LSGDYRRLLHVPTGLQHRVVHYSDVNQPDLLPDELTELQQQQQQQQQRKRKRGQPEQQQQQEKRQRLEPQESPGVQLLLLLQPEGMDVDQVQAVQNGSTAGDAAATTDGAVVASDEPAEPAAAAAAAGGGDGAADTSGSQGQRVGVILEFSLPSSCYATMLIRELTKSSTSKAAHKQLSAAQP